MDIDKEITRIVQCDCPDCTWDESQEAKIHDLKKLFFYQAITQRESEIVEKLKRKMSYEEVLADQEAGGSFSQGYNRRDNEIFEVIASIKGEDK